MAVLRAHFVSFNSGTYLATVRVDGSAAQVLAGIPTARDIAAAEMTAGRRVLLDTGDHNHPSDFVVTVVYV